MDPSFRRNQFKKGISVDDARKGRQQVTIEIRKNAKLEAQQKRRNIAAAPAAAAGAPPPAPGAPAAANTAPVYDNTTIATHAAGTSEFEPFYVPSARSPAPVTPLCVCPPPPLSRCL